MTARERPNVVLIVVDALRADHLSAYGYPRATSPHLDALAAAGVLCESMYCAGIPTQPAFTTIHTGQAPMTHGIVSHGGTAELSKKTPTLAELFLAAGYTTCTVDNLMRERLWFGRGFEYVIDPSLRRILHLGVTCEELNARAVPWLRAHAAEPFFLFIHYWDPHTPYTPPAPDRGLFYNGGNPTDPSNRSLDEWWRHPMGVLARETWLQTPAGRITDAEYLVSLYDSEIHHVDRGIAELVGTIDELGLGDRTLVAVTADHGESMTEHGVFFEHHGLYESTVHVPFVARWPGRIPAGRRLPQLLQHHDIAPTILEAAGLRTPGAIEGRSRWKLLSGQGDDPGREVLFMSECTHQAKWALRVGRHKFILARAPDFYGTPLRELYDLESDPAETINLAEREAALAASMEAQLEEWIAKRVKELGRGDDPLREQGISLKPLMSMGS
jgi:arylsulfatase A-like enzyme